MEYTVCQTPWSHNAMQDKYCLVEETGELIGHYNQLDKGY